jgi:hypothetical protein
VAWSSTEIQSELWRRGSLDHLFRPTQKEISDWWNDTDAMLSIIHARRGFGKTVFLLLRAFGRMAREQNNRLVYAAPSREMAKQIVIPTAHLIIPPDLPTAIKPVWVATEHAFIHPTTLSRCVVEGADDDQGDHLRGPFAHEVYGDEVAFWRYLERVWRSVLYPQIQRTGGKAIFVSTSPESPQHEFAMTLIPEAKAEGSYVKVSLEDDYTVTQSDKDKIAAQYSANRDPDDGRKSTQYRREFGCELVTESERAVLPEFDVGKHVGECVRPEYFDGYTVLDLGMTDLSVALLSYYDFANACIVVEDEVVRQYCTVSQLAPLIFDAERNLWGSKPPRKRMSDAQPISLAEFGRQHLLQPDLVPKEMRFAAVNNRDPEALINRTRTLLASRRIKIHPRCENLIKQCLGGLWNIKRTDYERIPGLGHLDAVMALVYTVDCIDFANNPELSQRKYDPDNYPVEMYKNVVAHEKQYSNAQQSLMRLLPKSARKTKVRR